QVSKRECGTFSRSGGMSRSLACLRGLAPSTPLRGTTAAKAWPPTLSSRLGRPRLLFGADPFELELQNLCEPINDIRSKRSLPGQERIQGVHIGLGAIGQIGQQKLARMN